MREAFLCFFILLNCVVFGQRHYEITLHESIAKNREFSGLAVSGKHLFLLPEFHGREGLAGEKFIYCLKLKTLKSRVIKKSNAPVPISKQYRVEGLNELLQRKNVTHQWEGFESMVIIKNTCYFTIETVDSNVNCYLVKGVIKHDRIVMDTALYPLPRLKMFENAGFEAMARWGRNELLCFYEYNAADIDPKMLIISTDLGQQSRSFPIPPVDLRITDVTKKRKRKLFAINYYWGGEYKYYINNRDSAVKQSIPDLQNANLNTKSFAYGRIISFGRGMPWGWRQVATLPNNHNWEGLAYAKNGFFVISDGNKDDKQGTALIYVW
jgi:hypothetical protein